MIWIVLGHMKMVEARTTLKFKLDPEHLVVRELSGYY